MLIRTATVADAPALAALFNHEIRHTLSTFRSAPRTAVEVAGEISAKAARDHPFLVAETERIVLGLATYGQFRANDGYRHTVEHSIVLAPAARGQGLGRRLMAALEGHATAAGHHSLIAGVSGANTAGVGIPSGPGVPSGGGTAGGRAETGALAGPRGVAEAAAARPIDTQGSMGAPPRRIDGRSTQRDDTVAVGERWPALPAGFVSSQKRHASGPAQRHGFRPWDPAWQMPQRVGLRDLGPGGAILSRLTIPKADANPVPGLYRRCMSLWTRIADAVSALRQGQPLGEVFDRLRTPPERSVAFAIAVIALGAKMAKADGQVTRTEVAAFREVFHIPKEEEQNAARVFNLARQDVAGFDAYAQRIATMFGRGHQALGDLLEGLFHIAVSDGDYHPNEEQFLKRVSDIFGLSERDFRGIRSRFVADAKPDPYDVLGIEPEASLDQIRARWRTLVRESHPDRMIARGVPEEAVRMAEKRLIAINRAWEEIADARG